MSESNPLSSILGILLLIFIGVISIPLFIYSWIRLYKLKTERYISERYIPLIIIQSIFMFISSNIITPISVSYEDTKNIKSLSITFNAIYDIFFLF